MTPNDPKLSDSGVRRGTCTAGGKAAVEAGAVTHGAVRCSAWLGDGWFMLWWSFWISRKRLNAMLPSQPRGKTINVRIDCGCMDAHTEKLIS